MLTLEYLENLDSFHSVDSHVWELVCFFFANEEWKDETSKREYDLRVLLSQVAKNIQETLEDGLVRAKDYGIIIK